jgi:nucleoid-associated protein YgaU
MRLVTTTALMLALSMWTLGCQPQKPKETAVTPGNTQTPDSVAPEATTPEASTPATVNPPPINPPPMAGGNTYVVKPHDTLWKIAKEQLGNGKRWTEIKALNPEIQGNAIKTGQTLKMPGK